MCRSRPNACPTTRPCPMKASCPPLVVLVTSETAVTEDMYCGFTSRAYTPWWSGGQVGAGGMMGGGGDMRGGVRGVCFSELSIRLRPD